MNDASRRAAHARLHTVATILAELQSSLDAKSYGAALDKCGAARAELNALAADLLAVQLSQSPPVTDEAHAQLRAALRQLVE